MSDRPCKQPSGGRQVAAAPLHMTAVAGKLAPPINTRIAAGGFTVRPATRSQNVLSADCRAGRSGCRSVGGKASQPQQTAVSDKRTAPAVASQCRAKRPPWPRSPVGKSSALPSPARRSPRDRARPSAGPDGTGHPKPRNHRRNLRP